LGGLSIVLCQFGCDSPNVQSHGDSRNNPLAGSWRLIKSIEIGDEDSTGRRHSGNIIYLKHLNSTHFTWIHYDKSRDKLLGTGGGTYALEAPLYTENIKFFYPSGSSELGQSIPFNIELKNDQWRHTGYSKIIEFNGETGEPVVADSAIIDELWQRVETKSEDDSNGKLIGTWNLISYKEPFDLIWRKYPDFVGYIKVITSTHFAWTKYNREGDEIIAIGGGTYSINNGHYTETINYHYPPRPEVIEINAEFDWKLENHTWYHFGEIEDGNQIDFVREIWTRYDLEE